MQEVIVVWTNLESVSLTADQEYVTQDQVTEHRKVVIGAEFDDSHQGQDVEEEGEHGQRDEAGYTEPVQHLDQLQIVHHNAARLRGLLAGYWLYSWYGSYLASQ